MGKSASSLRYEPAPDRNAAFRDRIVALAHRHRRYGAGMIALKWRQAGVLVNHTRVYAEARLQVRRRRRKKVPPADRRPLARPQIGNEVWSADVVFDRTADGRIVKCLTIVADATTEAVAIVAARALGGLPLTRPGSACPRAGAAKSLADRQRPRVLRSCDAHVGARPRRHLTCDRARQAESARVYRIVQWSLPRRVLERALVYESRSRPSRDRDPATGIQRGAPQEKPSGLTPAPYARKLAAERSLVTAGL